MGSITREYEVASRLRSDLAFNEIVQELDAKLKETPDNGDLWMERGLALAKQGHYRAAADSYSMAIAADPFKGIYYRHRAHRFLSCYRFEDACADFTIASRMIPDNWDVWYHLALSHFLLRDYAKAEEAYKRCYEITFQSDETERQLAAIANWYWITLQRLGKKEEAQAILDSVPNDLEPGPNVAYMDLVKMYKGLVTPEELLADDEDVQVNFITRGFGIANYYEHLGQRAKSDAVIENILKAGNDTGTYFAFGCIAAMLEKEYRDADV